MRRRYFAELYKERIEFIKSINPNTCIGVDVIVGFPGEEEEDFLKTYEFINSLDISYLHVFTYSERPNTDALKIDKIVPKEERSKRSKMLHILSDKKKRSFYESFTGNTKPVLFESYKNEKLIGHSDNYIKVEANGPKELINTIRDVKLIKNQGNIFQGIICK
jgi:threonylcarbamoyladenosine tRNA methylthiotransferase MtaB